MNAYKKKERLQSGSRQNSFDIPCTLALRYIPQVPRMLRGPRGNPVEGRPEARLEAQTLIRERSRRCDRGRTPFMPLSVNGWEGGGEDEPGARRPACRGHGPRLGIIRYVRCTCQGGGQGNATCLKRGAMRTRPSVRERGEGTKKQGAVPVAIFGGGDFCVFEGGVWESCYL